MLRHFSVAYIESFRFVYIIHSHEGLFNQLRQEASIPLQTKVALYEQWSLVINTTMTLETKI